MQSTRTENAWAALISASRKAANAWKYCDGYKQAAELITLLCNALEKEVEKEVEDNNNGNNQT